MSTETTAPDPAGGTTATATAASTGTTGTTPAAPARPSRWTITAADAARIATFAALICVLSLAGQIQFTEGMAPITLQTLGVMLAGTLLGAYRGALAVATFLLLALAGLPILAGGSGGPAPFVGPTAGYLYGWLFGAALTGWLVDRVRGRLTVLHVFGAALAGGVGVVYAFGIPVTAVVTGLPLGKVVALSAVYLPGDVVKAVIAAVITVAVVKAYPAASPAARRSR
ncbi:biotin transporter BioY [Luteimicrobium subarcticum]|uniref:Biotin transporter n=1 Tax=Luteimicrobium subarcticum TaxID=620910 RepID=A0A2M8WUC5_9MICO|nr:biotin transporter BioY [Luteimicrobium subarcticum]PJI94508.1 biotin transport system substrate-specific component [Luteimicrobium subarcticum]